MKAGGGFSRSMDAASNSPRTPSSTWRRADTGAVLFVLACAGLAAGLAFADYLPPRASVALVVAAVALFAGRAFLTRTLAPRTAGDWANALAVILLPIGLLVSADRGVSWIVVCKILGGIAIFYGVAGLAGTRAMSMLPGVFLIASIGFTVFAALDTAWPTSKIPLMPAGLSQALPSLALPGADAGGFNPNITGGALAFLLPPAAALALWGRGRWLRLLAVVTIGLLGLALLLTQSRGAWLAAACALAIMPGVRHRRWWLVILVAAIGAVAGVLLAGPTRVVGMFFPAVGMTEASANTFGGRLELWSRALFLIQDFSFTGAGPGLFQKVVALLYPLFLTGPDVDIPHAHNVFLQAAVDFGIPGLIAHAALLLALASALIAALRRYREGALAALAIGLLAALGVYLVHGMIDATLYASQRTYILAAAVLGVAAALSQHLLASESHYPAGGPNAG